MAAVVVERSNSFISDIDWTVHGIECSSPCPNDDSFSRMRERLRSFGLRTLTFFVNGLRIYMRINRFVLAHDHAREGFY